VTDFTIRETGEPRRLVAVGGTMRQALELAQLRLMVVGGLFVLCCLVVILRLTQLAVLGHGEPEKPEAATTSTTQTASRANIVDRNGNLLATSLETASLYADPAKIIDPKDAAKHLVDVFPDLTYGEVLQKLQSEERFVWIKRDITPRQEYDVQLLGIPGLDFKHGDTRIYPFGASTVHVVGFTNIDGRGMAGIERSFNNILTTDDKPLELSLDVRLQHIMRRELGQAIQDFNGIGGCGIIMDVKTGEILSLVSLPDFDPHEAGTAPEQARFNRNTLGVYEMGSTFKVFNTAMVLDSGKVKMTDSFDATHPLHVGRFTIDDFEKMRRWMTVPEIFAYSSNIGSVQEALVVGTETQQRFLGSLGLTHTSPIELPELGAPLIPHPWSQVNLMTIAFGHGMSVAPIQLATGVAAIVNGGILHKPTLIKQTGTEDISGTRVISENTSQLMRRLMRLQVVEGTGKNANVPGYLVGGKTGTAEKVLNGSYGKKALLSSFVGVFPMTNPRYLVLAMVDEPKPNAHSYGFATGGWVAAPAVGHIINQIGPLLGVDPIDETAPDVVEAMALDNAGKIDRVALSTAN
jgi:cell division protein FtsI (penicillin-binding protein 3)